MSPRIDIFALEITESFADIYSKLSKKDIPFQFIGIVLTIEGVLFVKDLLRHLDEKDFAWNTLIREPFLFLRIRN
jgi:CBS domain containing-hemolysin-like protein